MKTVNFIEAINSGKRFRFEKGECWFTWSGSCLVDSYSGDKYPIKTSDINARYVIEEKSIKITESEFDDVINNYFTYLRPKTEVVKNIKKELGF